MKPREVLQCDLNGNPMRIYKSIKEAAMETGTNRSGISAVVNHNEFYSEGNRYPNTWDGKSWKKYEHKTAGGYIWKYVDELEESNE